MSRVTANWVGPGDTVTMTAPYARSGGQGMKVGSLFAVAMYDVSSGGTAEGKTTGEWSLDSDTGAAWSVGDKIYWDDTNKVTTKTSTDNTLIGVCTSAKTSGATSGRVRLNGTV